MKKRKKERTKKASNNGIPYFIDKEKVGTPFMMKIQLSLNCFDQKLAT